MSYWPDKPKQFTKTKFEIKLQKTEIKPKQLDFLRNVELAFKCVFPV